VPPARGAAAGFHGRVTRRRRGAGHGNGQRLGGFQSLGRRDLARRQQRGAQIFNLPGARLLGVNNIMFAG
jgi:hypothetical protein